MCSAVAPSSSAGSLLARQRECQIRRRCLSQACISPGTLNCGWRSRLSDDASANRERIETWEVLKKELKDQFLPCNTSWLARESLRNLKHTGTVREFVKEFSSLMLDVRDMSEEDKLFNFMAGLKPSAQTGVETGRVSKT
ncbi:UNVERIFIED_CONTAM: hypothetical protein Sangu_2998100 [Sesamum angustifolium]|uniref:Retrotransposon gag domain-containing protein n=1 Tax=Sesamum angustifolium TaxID=2727405 RepID=A0AAW2KPU3_9LAMI